MIKLSIITINYNNYEGLKKTIGSVLNQTYANIEYILVDGKSDDGSVGLILEVESEIDYWISERDRGVYHAMNKGIEKSTGDYLLFLNSGDWLAPNSLDDIEKWDLTEDIITFDTYHYYDQDTIGQFPGPEEFTMRYFFKSTIMHQSTLIKKELFEKYGNYNEDYRLCADYDFWIRTIIANNCSTRYIPHFLSYYDRNGLTSAPRHTRMDEHLAILANYLPAKVVEDYQFWAAEEEENQVLAWYKKQRQLYAILVFLQKKINYIYARIHPLATKLRGP